MARTSNEVIVGAGTLYTAPVGTAYPAAPTAAPSGTWADIGYSEEGWVFAIDRDLEDIMVAEEFDSIRTMVTSRDIHVRGTVVQASLANLKIAIGGTIATVSPTSTYTPPSPTDAIAEVALLLRVNAPMVGGAFQPRDIQVPRAVAVGAVELAHNKAPNVTAVAFDFKALLPAAGTIFTILDDIT